MWWIYEFCLKYMGKAPGLFHLLGGLLGRVKYFFWPPDVARIVRNIRIVTRRRIPRILAFFKGSSVLANFVHYWLDVVYYGHLAPDSVEEIVSVVGEEHLRSALEEGKGCITATAHLGNWEVAGFWLGRKGYPIHAVALPHNDPRINEFFDSARMRHGVSVIPTGRTTRAIGVLKSGGILAILGDWDFTGGKAVVEVEFFGRGFLFPSGMGVFATRFGVPVVPIFCLRRGRRYELRIFPPIDPEGKNPAEVVQEYARSLETVLEKDYLQWYMFGPMRYAKEQVDLEKVCVVMPAYNEEKHIGPLLEQLGDRGLRVIVVDDGSHDRTSEVAQSYPFVTVERLSCNEGKGVAIKEGLARAKQMGYEWAVLMDADGQHLPSDLDKFLSAVHSGVGMVCGNRMGDPKGMPFIRRFTNWLMSFIISAYTWDWIPDTQCGYRLIRLSAIDPEELTSDKYEIETDLILRVRERGWDIVSVPIQSVYHDTAVSYINPVRDTLRFIWFMLMDAVRKITRSVRRK